MELKQDEVFNLSQAEIDFIRPPKEAYFFMPNFEDLVTYDTKNPEKTLRWIFEGGVQYLDFENQKINELHEFIKAYNEKSKDKPFTFPEYWSDDQTLRFLQGCNYDYKKVMGELSKHFEYRALNYPPRISDKVTEILNLGWCYTHGRDHHFRPIIILKTAIYKKYMDKYPFELWLQTLVFFMEYVIKYLLIPGQVETWDVINDVADASLLTIPSDFKKLIIVLQDNYRCRLYRMYVLNLSMIMRGIIKLVQGFMDPITVKKIVIVGSKYTELSEIINKSQIEERYGGKAKNVTSNFFPHNVPSEQYLMETDDPQKMFISEEKYVELLEKNPKMVRSPYFSQSKN